MLNIYPESAQKWNEFLDTLKSAIEKHLIYQGPDISDQELKGIIPRMNGTIFETVQNANQNIEFLVKASYIEIYMEKIRDLLDGMLDLNDLTVDRNEIESASA